MRTLLLLASLVFAVAVAMAPRCSGQRNANPVWTAPPVLTKQVPNGKLFTAGNGTDTFYVAHVYGTHYEMGVAYGAMFADIIPIGVNRLYDWIEQQLEQKVPWLPAWFAALVADFGVPFALQVTYNNTKPFNPQKYVDEMNGVAAGAGVDVTHVQNINMLAELIKAQCSVIGANGAATAQGPLNGSLAHLRTLDGMGGYTMPIKDYALVAVFHPDASLDEPVYANFGWVGLLGSVTGFGEHVGVGEKLWADEPANSMSVHGEAWTFITRDVLAAKSFADAKQILVNAHRTCAVHLGLGGRAHNEFAGVEMDADVITFFNASSQLHYPQHPYFEGIVYWDKYGQPTQSYCFADLFAGRYGRLDAEWLATTVAGTARTGDLHAATFDYASQVAYFSNARKTFATDGAIYAYDRQFTRLDMAAAFAEPKPSV